MNLRNIVILSGRVSKEPVKFDNADGSKKYMVTLAVQDNFRSGADNERATQFIQVEGFVPAGKEDKIYSGLKVGEKITIQGSIRNNNYKDKNGQAVYGLVIRVETLDFGESKAAVEARANASTIPVPPAQEAAPAQEPAKTSKKSKKTAAKEADMPFAE